MEQVYSLNYMLKLIKAFCDNGGSDYMFIKHYNTLSLPEQFVKNAKVYPMQQSSFAAYIRTGKADRLEDIMIIEIAYESKRMLDSIVNMYQYILMIDPEFV